MSALEAPYGSQDGACACPSCLALIGRLAAVEAHQKTDAAYLRAMGEALAELVRFANRTDASLSRFRQLAGESVPRAIRLGAALARGIADHGGR